MVFKENKKSLESIPNINKKIIEFINAPESLKRAEKELKFMEKNNVNHLFYTDKNYPSNLKLCMDSPVNLFYKGSINWNNQRFMINVTNDDLLLKRICDNGSANMGAFK